MHIINPEIKRKFLLIQKPMLSDMKKFIAANLIETEILAGLAGVLYVSRFVPYANVLLDTSVSLFILVVTSQVLYRLTARYIITTSLLFFPVAFVQLISGNSALAESTGNLIYFLLWYACILYIIELRNQKK